MSIEKVKNAQADLIKLRELTGAGMMDCQKALKEAKGDIKQAQDVLRRRGLDIAKKKSMREAKQGQIVSYIHAGGKLGVLVEINCESDFVARNETFQVLAKNIAMQIAAAHPLYVSSGDIPEQDLAREKAQFAEEVKSKPPAVQEKIIQGKLEKRFEEICLLNQKYIKEDSRTVQDYLSETIAKLGENIIIRRFVRFEVGGTSL
ncbi:MAG: translation elongation factor Ts [Candidatus Omnitrophica bacterium]|nr:translation elongation factor Ts [Candidatus Omnitrophota bacterium]MDD5672333.1 translation elongation factor Ts [Candidatus Omnitrophota bacterium]